MTFQRNERGVELLREWIRAFDGLSNIESLDSSSTDVLGHFITNLKRDYDEMKYETHTFLREECDIWY